jgi:hypothetical protein
MHAKHLTHAAVLGLALNAVAACFHPASAAPPFPLGAYLGNPNGSNQQDEAEFEASYASFVSTLGTSPRLILSYIDYTQPVTSWPSNTSWQAWSNAQSPDARNLIPVLGLPMYSIESGSPTPDQQYCTFASGAYDSVLQAIVYAWAQQGFKKMFVRPAWEMNITGNTYVGSDSQSQADFIHAFRHIYTIMHAAAVSYGVDLKIVWNPSATNYTSPSATSVLYPGDTYVDVIAADYYGDMYPFSDGGNPPTYHDWHTGGEDTSVAQFIADPVNRAHYWTWPAATKWSLDGSDGHSLTMSAMLSFAQSHAKPFAIAEAGAGNCNAGRDVCDDPTFASWLASTLKTAAAGGQSVSFVDIWDNNGGGNYEFSFSDDKKPSEAAEWGSALGTK